MFYVDHSSITNFEIFKLWKQHYSKLNIPYYIKYDDSFEHQDSLILITEYDFLFYFTKNSEDTMILHNEIDSTLLQEQILIGKIFYVPIPNKQEFTTFEIPDFILYKHEDHSNFVDYGIKLHNFVENNSNNTLKISDNLVFLCLKSSNVKLDTEYYETNALYDNTFWENIYQKMAFNIYVNKELKYGIIWNEKCACTTITKIFYEINNENENYRMYSLAHNKHKYRYNVYLQNFDFIIFVRHPFMRFISCYFNKQIMNNYYKDYPLYNSFLTMYKDKSIHDFAIFTLNNGFIDSHYNLLTNYYYNTYNLNYHIYYIELGVEKQLYSFLIKYHKNIIVQNNFCNITPVDTKSDEIDSKWKFYSIQQWKEHYALYKEYPNYICILDTELKSILAKIYKKDLEKFNYNPDKIITLSVEKQLNLILPFDFNVNNYKTINADLSILSDIEAKIHFIKFGELENRLYKLNLPNDFDVKCYKNLNDDLQSMSDIEAQKHFILHGINEKRLYKLPDNLNVSIYKQLNPDLNHISDVEAIKHYLNFNKLENRRTKYKYIIQTTLRDEEQIVNEWIEHHLKLGFEHIFIYDDASKIPLSTTIQKLSQCIQDKLTIIRLDFDFFNDEDLKLSNIYDERLIQVKNIRNNKQKYIMNFFLKKFKYASDWCFFGDVDEFICLNKLDNLDNLLSSYENYDSLYIPWLMYGTSYFIDLPKGSIRDSFVYHTPNYSKIGKSICKIEKINCIDNCHLIGKNVYYLNHETKVGNIKIHINHYNKIDVKTFLRRKLRPEIGIVLNNRRSPENILEMLLDKNDNICGKENNNCSFALLHKNTIILPTTVITYEILNDLMLDKNLRYCTWDEVLPKDFTAESYKELNEDLKHMNDYQCKKHYVLHGKNEQRIYFLNLPKDFDVKIYKHLNPDLANLSDVYCKTHYSKHGLHEGRQYQDPFFDKNFFAEKYGYSFDYPDIYLEYTKDIRQCKNKQFTEYINTLKYYPDVIILCNHDNSLYGASHYLYILYGILKNKYNCILCDVYYKHELLDKYNISKNDVIEYKNDPTLLYKIYEFYQPMLIYFNSINVAMMKVYDYVPREKIILHSHEIQKHYLLGNITIPDFVVSERIKNQYKHLTQHANTNFPLLQTPIITNLENIILKSCEEIENNINNNYGTLNRSKITIGMCGQITMRKNYKLFIEIAQLYSQYNFIWVGGDKSQSNIFEKYPNIYHVPFTLNPYKYYKQIIDVFILFSTEDPCPYVILENLLLETKIITFEKNIFIDHKHNLTKDIYIEYPGEINVITCSDAINKYVFEKKNTTSNNGYLYISKYFTNVDNVLKRIIN